MKRIILSLLVSFFSVVSVYSQQISVVDTLGVTSVFDKLDDAINQASAGSTIYLPGGSSIISDATVINKKLTIMGIGHRSTDNLDGLTMVSGKIQFGPGSEGSILMSLYLSGEVRFGVGGASNGIIVKNCNVNNISTSSKSNDLVINQNYIRNDALFAGGNVLFFNNVCSWIGDVTGGVIEHNVFTGTYNYNGYSWVFYYIHSSTVRNNICLKSGTSGDNTVYQNNVFNFKTSNFVKYSGISPDSDFRFTEAYEGDRTLGIYGGSGFSNDSYPTRPYIVSKNIPGQTDSQGKLRIQVTVKAK